MIFHSFFLTPTIFVSLNWQLIPFQNATFPLFRMIKNNFPNYFELWKIVPRQCSQLFYNFSEKGDRSINYFRKCGAENEVNEKKLKFLELKLNETGS